MQIQQQYAMIPMTTPEQCYAVLEQQKRPIFVQEMMDMVDLMVGWNTGNRYLIQNDQNQTIMMAQEVSNPLARNYAGGGDYGFAMNISVMGANGVQMPFLTMQRPWVCQCGCFSCCCQQPFVIINDSMGRQVGHIEEPYQCGCKWIFNVHDEQGQHAITLAGHCCPGSCGCPCCCTSIE